MTTTYAKRQTAFDRGEHHWRVEPDALVWTRPDGETLTVLWRDVTAIRAAFAPTRFKSWRHVFEIVTRQRLRLVIDNAHLRGVGDFEDRSDTFAPFVLACIERVAAAAPGARGWLGSGPAGYWAQLAFAGSMMALLTVVLVALPTTLPGVVLVKLALVAAMLPTAAIWVVRSRPRPTALDPAAFLPGLPDRADKFL